jgi:hypothetical protein
LLVHGYGVSLMSKQRSSRQPANASANDNYALSLRRWR